MVILVAGLHGQNVNGIVQELEPDTVYHHKLVVPSGPMRRLRVVIQIVQVKSIEVDLHGITINIYKIIFNIPLIFYFKENRLSL